MSITVRFIRLDNPLDDKVIIKQLGDDQYVLSYTYGDTKNPVPTSSVMNGDTVFRWMRNVMRLVEADDDPFDSIQMDLPLMPSILVRIDSLDGAYDAILNSLELHLDNWPRHKTVTRDPTEEETEEEGESDGYSDMPELVSTHSNFYNSHYRFDDDGEVCC